jgi:hypothetical protein
VARRGPDASWLTSLGLGNRILRSFIRPRHVATAGAVSLRKYGEALPDAVLNPHRLSFLETEEGWKSPFRYGWTLKQ